MLKKSNISVYFFGQIKLDIYQKIEDLLLYFGFNSKLVGNFIARIICKLFGFNALKAITCLYII